MEIIRETAAGDWLELRVKGRLDSYWADHFKTALSDAIRDGACKVRLEPVRRHLPQLGGHRGAGVGPQATGEHPRQAGHRPAVGVGQEGPGADRPDHAAGDRGSGAESSRQATTVAMGRPVHREGTIFEVFPPDTPAAR